ncbi:hypothetical protein [Roseiflexus castenholzii]|uniref:hypothetical protein n=1 Tax=Roseiflexus castenholzii TaxID=120962 RepID=UPI003C7BA661
MGAIITRHLGNMLFDPRLGNHTLLIDVPASMGGTDRVPRRQSYSLLRRVRGLLRLRRSTANVGVR